MEALAFGNAGARQVLRSRRLFHFECPHPGVKLKLPTVIHPAVFFDYPYVNGSAKIAD